MRHTQSKIETPHYQEILDFFDFRAQASEASGAPSKKQSRPNHVHFKRQQNHGNPKFVSTYTTNVKPYDALCPLCLSERHPLYACTKFKLMPHDVNVKTVNSNNRCLNCLAKGHVVATCKSLHRSKKCHGPHNTLLHSSEEQRKDPLNHSAQPFPTIQQVSANAVANINSNTLLMTCRINIVAPDGSSITARALLDSASSTSFITKRLTQLLRLKCSRRDVTISGVGDLPSKSLV